MEVKEFLEKKKRLCEYYEDCYECPLGEFITCAIDENKQQDEIIRLVEEWEEPTKVEYKSTEFPSWSEQINIVLDHMDNAIGDLTKRVTDLEKRLTRSVDDFR